jgi:putative phosphoesterase
MLKIALISDIHANLPALEACLAHIQAQQVDAVYCLGDLVGYNVWPNEVIALIRQNHIPTIKGNYDEGVGEGSDDCGCVYKTEDDRDRGKQSIAYTNQIIGEAERTYLRTLPSHLTLDFRIGQQNFRILLVHGSPRKINEYLFEDRDEASLVRIMQQAKADILCFGHTHKPFHRIMQDNTTDQIRLRHAINTGSVGKPKDGSPQGHYILLRVDPGYAGLNSNAVIADIVRFDYDVEKAARAIENSPLPNAFADMLRSGI